MLTDCLMSTLSIQEMNFEGRSITSQDRHTELFGIAIELWGTCQDMDEYPEFPVGIDTISIGQ
jgi:hypothetical protein